MQQSLAQQPNFPEDSELYFLGMLLVMCQFLFESIIISSSEFQYSTLLTLDNKDLFLFILSVYSSLERSSVLLKLKEIRLMEVLASAIVTGHRGRKQRSLSFDISSEAFSMFQCCISLCGLQFLHLYHHLNPEFINYPFILLLSLFKLVSCLEHCNDSLPYIRTLLFFGFSCKQTLEVYWENTLGTNSVRE